MLLHYKMKENLVLNFKKFILMSNTIISRLLKLKKYLLQKITYSNHSPFDFFALNKSLKCLIHWQLPFKSVLTNALTNM
jgi:hypothetical protein